MVSATVPDLRVVKALINSTITFLPWHVSKTRYVSLKEFVNGRLKQLRDIDRLTGQEDFILSIQPKTDLTQS
jgi:hypothetical protein